MGRLLIWLLKPLTVLTVLLLALLGLRSLVGQALAPPDLGRVVAEAVDKAVTRETRTVPAAPVVLERVQALSRLETVRQVSRHMITATSEVPLLGRMLSKDELTLMVQVRASAGVDLAKLQPDDVRVEGSGVTINLPRPELFALYVDDSATQVLDRDRGLLPLRPDRHLESNARQEALRAARFAVLSQGLLTTAEKQAQVGLGNLLATLGFETVEFAPVQQAAAVGTTLPDA